MQGKAQIAQSHLIFHSKIIFGVASERSAIEWLIWRVKVDEIARARIQLSEVAHTDVHALQRRVAGAQNLWLTNRRILVTPHRHVEFTLAVHAPKAVVAGLVEVDEARRYLDAVVKIMLTSEVVIVFLAVILGMNPELGDEWFGVALDDLVGVDEIKVDII